MSDKKILYVSSLLALPVLYLAFYGLHITMRGMPTQDWFKWDRLLLLVTIIGLERLYTYKYAVSQRSVLTRDIIANVVNLYLTAAVAAMLIMPLLVLIPEQLFGRRLIIASPDQLGPWWLQILMIMLGVSFFRYWMHRWQHNNEFLWSLHSYHHRVTDLRASNAELSNPVDFALRNIVVFLILGIIGLDPFSIFIAVTITNVTAVFSHCGGDVKGGIFNYVAVTPEVHRWHHAVDVPQGYGYSCNYGVEFAFWDILFGTYYLPKKAGEVINPERIGHPSGLPDEPNYLKILLEPFGLYRPLPWFKPQAQQPAE